MMPIAPSEIRTSRTLLRRQRDDDLLPFTEMNADPAVMRYFAAPWTTDESRAAFTRIQAEFDRRGFGIYALEVNTAFAGVIGLSAPSFQSWFTPCVEVLWRLRPEFWNHGFASEAAAAVLAMARQSLSLPEIFAFAVAQNLPSIRVMEKIGMYRANPFFFDHPAVDDVRLKQHVLYRTNRPPD